MHARSTAIALIVSSSCIQITRMQNKLFFGLSLCMDLLAFRAVQNDVNTCKQLSNQSLEHLLAVNTKETNLVQLQAWIIASVYSNIQNTHLHHGNCLVHSP